MKNKLIFILGFVLLSIIYYFIWSYVDESFDDGMLLRTTAISLGAGFFYLLFKTYNKKWTPTFVFVMIIHLGSTLWVTDKINEQLLLSNHETVTAIISNCKKTRGTEYCNYCYSVKNKLYKHTILNEAPIYKYKNNDTIRVVYYINNPVVSHPE